MICWICKNFVLGELMWWGVLKLECVGGVAQQIIFLSFQTPPLNRR